MSKHHSFARNLRNFILLTLILVLNSPIFSEQKIFIIGSGSKQGTYFEIANELIKAFSSIQGIKLFNFPTSGSNENIQLIADEKIDFAIIQRDALIEKYYSIDNPLKSFEVILPLYPELLQIYVNGDGNLLDFNTLIDQIKSGEINTIAIGENDTRVNETFKSILVLFGVDTSQITLDASNFSKSINSLVNKKGFASVTISGYPDTRIINYRSKIDLVTFTKENLDYLGSYFHNLDKFNKVDHQFQNLESKTYSTLGSWALLVMRNDSIIKFEKYIQSENIIEHLIAQAFLKLNRFLKNNSILNYSPTRSEKFTNQDIEYKLLKSLPIYWGLEELIEQDEIITNNRLFILLCTIFGLVMFYFIYYRKSIDVIRYWYRYRHFFYSVVYLILLFFILSFLIYYYERKIFIDTGVKSSFYSLNPFDIQIWLLIFVISGFNNNIFPITYPGQLITTVSTYLGWSAAIISILSEILFNYRRKKRKLGLMDVHFSNHIVICGWNETSIQFIKSTVDALNHSTGTGIKRKIVIISEAFKEALDKSDYLQGLHDKKIIDYISSDAREFQALDKGNILKANVIILIAENLDHASDERTLLRALAISNYTRQKYQSKRDRIYIIAEVNDQKYKTNLLQADVNEVICKLNVNEKMLVQSMLNHGLSDVFDSILGYNEGNEFYSMQVKNHPDLKGKTFDQALVHLRANNILLIGIKVCYWDQQNTVIIDRDLINEHIKNDNLDSNLIINPFKSNEINYKVRLEDELIVLAEDENAIRKLSNSK